MEGREGGLSGVFYCLGFFATGEEQEGQIDGVRLGLRPTNDARTEFHHW